MKKLLGMSFLLFLVAGCASLQIQPASTPAEISTDALTETPQSMETRGGMIMEIVEDTPTVTPSPTPAPLKLPVLNGTPVPLSNIPIAVENADQVTELARYWGSPDAVVRVTHDGNTLVMANVEGIYFYDVPSGKLIRTIDAHIYFFHFDPWQPLSTYIGHYIAISADGERLAYLDENLFVHVLDAKGNELLKLHLESKDTRNIPRTNLELSPDGKTLAITMGPDRKYSEKMLLYDVDNGQQLPVEDTVANACFTGDGDYLVVDPKIIYSTSDWQKITPLAIKFNTFVTFACDPTSSGFAILSDKDVEVWDVASGDPLSTFPLPDVLNQRNFGASELGFSSDGTKLITFNRYGAKNSQLMVAGLIDIASGS